ncbi:MAG: very short patch repair endonuclease [Puniceicoccaceae bacterium]
MVDVFDSRKRSWVMSRIKGRDTRPEMVIRSLLHRLGYRFTVNGPRNRKLPGRPDIVLPKHRTVVLVHGCFWHGHPGCRHFRIPKTRTEWWTAKIENNRRRDRSNLAALEDLGWNVVVVWACEFDTLAKLEELAVALPRRIEQPALGTAPLKAAEEPAPYRSGGTGTPPLRRGRSGSEGCPGPR